MCMEWVSPHLSVMFFIAQWTHLKFMKMLIDYNDIFYWWVWCHFQSERNSFWSAFPLHSSTCLLIEKWSIQNWSVSLLLHTSCQSAKPCDYQATVHISPLSPNPTKRPQLLHCEGACEDKVRKISFSQMFLLHFCGCPHCCVCLAPTPKSTKVVSNSPTPTWAAQRERKYKARWFVLPIFPTMFYCLCLLFSIYFPCNYAHPCAYHDPEPKSNDIPNLMKHK